MQQVKEQEDRIESIIDQARKMHEELEEENREHHRQQAVAQEEIARLKADILRLSGESTSLAAIVPSAGQLTVILNRHVEGFRTFNTLTLGESEKLKRAKALKQAKEELENKIMEAASAEKAAANAEKAKRSFDGKEKEREKLRQAFETAERAVENAQPAVENAKQEMKDLKNKVAEFSHRARQWTQAYAAFVRPIAELAQNGYRLYMCHHVFMTIEESYRQLHYYGVDMTKQRWELSFDVSTRKADGPSKKTIIKGWKTPWRIMWEMMFRAHAEKIAGRPGSQILQELLAERLIKRQETKMTQKRFDINYNEEECCWPNEYDVELKGLFEHGKVMLAPYWVKSKHFKTVSYN